MLDEIDRAIVSQLQYDGRLPFTRIAEGLGITEGAVRRRVKQMADDGKLQIVGVVDPQELGWTEASLIGITVQSDLIEEVADVIARLPEVTIYSRPSGSLIYLPKFIVKTKSIMYRSLTKRFIRSQE